MNEVLRTPCEAAGVLIELESLVSARSASYSDVRHRTLSGRCVAQQLDVQKAIPYSCARPESEHIGVAPRLSLDGFDGEDGCRQPAGNEFTANGDPGSVALIRDTRGEVRRLQIALQQMRPDFALRGELHLPHTVL